jgi:hypothetical protein
LSGKQSNKKTIRTTQKEEQQVTGKRVTSSREEEQESTNNGIRGTTQRIHKKALTGAQKVTEIVS